MTWWYIKFVLWLILCFRKPFYTSSSLVIIKLRLNFSHIFLSEVIVWFPSTKLLISNDELLSLAVFHFSKLFWNCEKIRSFSSSALCSRFANSFSHEKVRICGRKSHQNYSLGVRGVGLSDFPLISVILGRVLRGECFENF